MGLLAAASPPPKGGAMGPVVPVVDQQDSGLVEAPWPRGTPLRGAEYGRERLAEGQAPMAPPLTLGFVLVSFTRKFADILGIDCL